MGHFLRVLKRYWFRVNAALLVLAAAFAYGLTVGLWRLPPYDLLEESAAGLQDWVRHPRHNARLEPEKFLRAADAARPLDAQADGSGNSEARNGVRNAHLAYGGVTLVSGFFDDSLGMRLLDMERRVIHEWKVSFNDIWPEAPHMDRPRHDWDIHIHGVHLFPNGDVVFNFQYGGLVKLDACGRTDWKVPAQTHHSIFAAADGNLWVPSRKWREEPHARFPNIEPPYWEELVLEVSPDGEILREVSILDVISRSGFEGVLFASGAHEATLDMPIDRDFTHVNDVEVLGADRAALFPLFEAGDVLVSARNLNLLLVLDGGDMSIKWWMVGPYLRQHDPDFTDRGTIAVFDNRRDGAGGRTFGGSRILEIDPQTRAITVRYEGTERHPFFTAIMGEQQYLPNGNVLVTESEAGRAFEVTPGGKIVWSYVNRWDERRTAMLGRAIRYPASYESSIGQGELSCTD